MVTGVDPVVNGQRGVPAGLYVVYGMQDPTVVPTAGLPGMLFLRIAPALDPTAPVAVYQKHTTDDMDTNWSLVGGSSSSDLDYKNPVDTIDDGSNINLAAPGAVINGVTMAVGMSFLATNQTSASENGIYTWNGAGVPATRRADANTDAEVTHGMFTWVDGNTGNLPTVNNLTGWILQTADPITLDVTALTFAEIPIPASVSTAISGLYFVAGNGNDANNGSIAAPFLTIQAAINKAVADGHNNSNNAEIIVLPKAAAYAGFTAVPGVNVTGFQGASARVRVGKVIFAPTTPVAINNEVVLTNLSMRVTNDNAFSFPASANAGKIFFNGCRFNNAAGAFASMLLENVGGTTNLSGCSVVGADDGVHVVAGLFVASGSSIGAPIDGDITGIALLVDSGAEAQITGGNCVTSGAGHSAADIFGTASFENVSIRDLSSGSDGLTIRTGATVRAQNCDITVEAIQSNYVSEGGSQFEKSNLTFNGSSTAVVANGVINVIPNSEEFTVENRIVTGPEAAAKALDLAKVPLPGGQIGLSCAGAPQMFGTAFTISGGGYTVDWNGLGMDLLPVVVGDEIIVTYQGSPRS